MRRTYRYPLQPSRQQEAVLLEWLEFCRELYNAALEERIGAWKRARARIGYGAQTRGLAELRAIDRRAASVPSDVARSALRRLDRSFQAFFRRCKAGERPGFPRFRGQGRYDSFSFGFGNRGSRIEGARIQVPKLGMVRFHFYRKLKGEIREVTVRRSCGRWWVCFSCDLGEAPEKAPIASAIGIDLGLHSFAVLSDGSGVANPRYFRQGEELLARRQRSLARKKRGSRSRERAKLLVAKAHERVRCRRLDFSRKLAAELLARYDLVAYEGLAIRNMICGSFAKSIHDAAWGAFLHALTCKAESAGKWAVAVDPRGTSQRCSGCGAVVRKALAERTHRCAACGLVIDRDANAARNILALAYSPGRGGVTA